MEEIEEVFEIIFPQPARTVMGRLNPLEWFSEDEFRTRFRLSKDTRLGEDDGAAADTSFETQQGIAPHPSVL